MNRTFSHGGVIPIAFSKSLSANDTAMQSFATLDYKTKSSLINGSWGIKSSAQMSAYIDNISLGDCNISYSEGDNGCAFV